MGNNNFEIKNMNLKEQFSHKYQLLSCNNIPSILGFGSHGAVQLAANKETGEHFAVKKIPRKLAFKESILHSQLQHSKIVKLIQPFFDHETKSTFLVLQYVSGGNLLDLMKSGSRVDLGSICKIFKGICQGLIEIHRNSIIHRDIKPANILLDHQSNPKICDFGSATIAQPLLTQICGTLEYLAPEVIAQKPYDQKIDTWSVGVMLYEAIEGRLPFSQKNATSLIDQMKRPLKFGQKISQNLMEIVQKMLSFNPELRPELIQIVRYLNKVQTQIFVLDQANKDLQKENQLFNTCYKSQNSTVDELDDNSSQQLIIKKDNSYNKAPNSSIKLFDSKSPQIIQTKLNFFPTKTRKTILKDQNTNSQASSAKLSKISITGLMLTKKQ